MPIPAPPPENELERLNALRAYDVLDTPPEPAFDRLTSLASEICRAPISLVSLVDESRQWFKSRCGLDASETPREHAFCAHAIHGDNVLVVSDATEDERFKDNPLVLGPPHIRSYAGAPLITGKGFRLGTLCVIHDEVTDLSATQLSQLQKLAAIVVDELELRRTLEQNKEVQETLAAQAAELMFANSTLEEQASQLVDLAEDRELLHQCNDRNRRFIETLIEMLPIPIYARDKQQIITHANPAYAALLVRKTDQVRGKHIEEIHDPDTSRDILEMDARLGDGPRAPQVNERRITPFGAGPCRDIVEHKAALRGPDGSVQGVVGAIVDVTEEKALRAKLERLAATDPLTGAANRRAFMERADTEVRRSHRYGYALSLIMIDVDKFKAINDSHGHQAGDAVLKYMSRVCSDTIRASVDFLARLGGEEFAVLCPETDSDGVADLAERLRCAVASQAVAWDGKEIAFTASFGVAAVDHDTALGPVEDAMRRADECLYAAKEGGRNRVMVWCKVKAAAAAPTAERTTPRPVGRSPEALRS